MTAEKLRRVALVEPLPPQIGPEIVNQAEIIRDAETRLGYKPERPMIIRNLNYEPPLHRALRVAGIKPFDRRQVEWYKMVVELKLGLLFVRLFTRLARMADYYIRSCNLFLSLITTVAFLSTIIFGSILMFGKNPTASYTTWFFASLGSILTLFGIFFISQFDKYELRCEWKLIPIKQYKEPIPTNVLALALEVKDHVPDAEILIDVFHVRYQTKDPFLVVKYGEEIYYIGVWNEPDFKPTVS